MIVRAIRGLRSALGRVLHRLIPEGMVRRELRQARAIMATASGQPLLHGPQVLFVSVRAWATHVCIETTMAQALRLRGARCSFFYCGGGLRICEKGWPATDQGRPCRSCGSYVRNMIDAAQLPVLSLADMVSLEEQDQIRLEVSSADGDALIVEGLHLAPLVEQSLLWHLRSGSVDLESTTAAQARRDFLVSAALMTRAATRVLDAVDPSVVVLMNGLFFEERIFTELARARGLRVVSYELGTQRDTLFFSTDSDVAAPNLDISDLWERHSEEDLASEQENELERALAARRSGVSMSWKYYPEHKVVPGVTGAGRRFVLFTNVAWDTAVTGRSLGFDSMFEWIEATIAYAQPLPDIDLIVRVHPAESRSPGLETSDRVTARIAQAFPVLPPNVSIIAPEDPVDTYSLVEAAEAVLVFSSTIGMEAAASGKPVAVAGKTHYRGRGFTVDVESREQYAELFHDQSWIAPDHERSARARRYAFLFLCRALVPFTLVRQPTFGDPILGYSDLDELLPGRDEVLDLICDGVLEGTAIRMPTAVAR